MTRDRRVGPALSPGRGPRRRAPLGRPPSLHHLRRRQRLALVRRLPRYYAVVRLPPGVHVGRTADGLPRPTPRGEPGGYLRDLPFPVRGVSTHAQGLRLRGVRGRLADSADLGVAFRFASQRRHPGGPDFAARWLAYVCPCQRFARTVTGTHA